MTALKIEYEVYLQELLERSARYSYDEDGHIVAVVHLITNPPLKYLDWLDTEMQDAIDQEDYEYAAKIRDEIIYLKLYTVEEFERYLA